MTKVASQFTCGCRCNAVSYSSQATPFKAFPGEFQGNHAARLLSPLEQLQYSLATTTFVGKQQQKQSAARSKRASPYTPRRKNVVSTKQRVDTQVQTKGITGIAANQHGSLQPIIPFYQLLTFIPSTNLGTSIQPQCAGTTNNVCHQPGNQNNFAPAHFRRLPYYGSSVSIQAPYSVPTSSYSEATDSPHSVVKAILHADNKGKYAKSPTCMPQQLHDETLELADAFERGKIRLKKPFVSSESITGNMTSNGIVTPVVEERASAQTKDALMDISKLLAEAADLSDAFARGEIRIEEQKEPVVTVSMASNVTVTPAVKDRATAQTNDALMDISKLLAKATDLSEGFASGEIRIEEQIEAAVAKTTVVDMASGMTDTPIVGNSEKMTSEEGKQTYVWCSLPDLDLSDTKGLFDGTFNDMDINSIYDMYLPPEVPSTNIGEVLASKEFSELMKIIDTIKRESQTLESQSKSEKVDGQLNSIKKVCKGASVHHETLRDALAGYVPDMFSFSKSQQEEVKFDVFDINPVDGMAFDVHNDIACSRKRKASFSDVVDNKRQRVRWREAPELYI